MKSHWKWRQGIVKNIGIIGGWQGREEDEEYYEVLFCDLGRKRAP